MTDSRTDDVNVRVSAFRRDLESPQQREQLRLALPRHIDPDFFCRVVMTAVQSNDELEKGHLPFAAARDDGSRRRRSAARRREGAIVAYRYRDTATWIANWQPMVWGLVKLVRQSGELIDVGSHIVTVADRFDYLVDEDGEHFEHRPDFLQPDATPLLVYAYARTRDGGHYFEPMAWSEVEKFNALSKAQADEAPWQRWPQEMAKVRVIRRLCKRLPMSTDARAAITRDDARDAQRLAPAPEVIDPVSAINATIRAAAASNVAALDAPAPRDDAAPAPKASRGPRKRTTTADAGKPPDETAPLTFTYAQIAERLNRAKDLAELSAASKLIDAVADEQQREELRDLVGQIAAERVPQKEDGTE